MRRVLCVAAGLAAVFAAAPARAGDDDVAAIMLVSECLGAAGFDEIVSNCTKAIESGKVNATSVAVAYHKRGWAYQQKGESEKAIADFNETIQRRPDYGSAYSGRAGAWFSLGDYGKAVTDGTEAIRQSAQDVFAYNIRGMAFLNLKNYDAAIGDLTKAMELVPGYAPYYQFRGDAYAGNSDRGAAKADYTQCLAIDETNKACKDALKKL